MVLKLVAFDVDGTLSEPDKSIEGHVAERIRSLEAKGIRILLISGKNAFYLAGLARGLGIQNPLVAGENGCVILEPLKLREIRLAQSTELIQLLKSQVEAKYHDQVWLQPNLVAFTVFPKDAGLVDEIYQYIKLMVTDTSYKVLKHVDAIDVLPPEINKGKALSVIKEMYGVTSQEVIAVGDSESDLSMAGEVRNLVMIGYKTTTEHAIHFAKVDQAFAYLEEQV